MELPIPLAQLAQLARPPLRPVPRRPRARWAWLALGAHRALPQGLRRLQGAADHSWLRDLSPEPDQAHQPNREKRLVSSGHFVKVRPLPLLNTRLVCSSPSMAEELKLSEDDVQSPEFLRFMSGHMEVLPDLESWCTPYTLSVAGNEISTGNMYGDGRAISVGEVQTPQRWELQLKGAGPTPFRNGDGRAVLRSSLREFLASEALHHLGVPSTRALCVTMSTSDTALREWLGESLQEPCAMTCRSCSSFLRVGHLELFGRRARDWGGQQAQRELLQLVQHLIEREYPECLTEASPITSLLGLMAQRFAHLAAEWWRVGFCQGNFQSDNCHLGGKTLDFGPFGFMEKYNPLYCSWTGGAANFSFRLQPKAFLQNLSSAFRAMEPLLDSEGRQEAQEVLRKFPQLLREEFREARMRKMGFSFWDEEAARLCEELLGLLEASRADWTLTWRRLTNLAQDWDEYLDSDLLLCLEGCFYEPLSAEAQAAWRAWLWRWLARLRAGDLEEAVETMRLANPKYVPRNWMLLQAYEAAEAGNFQVARDLQRLLATPYAEHPEEERQYFRLTPPEMRLRPGVFVMT